MTARVKVLSVLAAAVVLTSGPASAQLWENDVRLRAGTFIPSDLPTESGPIFGLEVRNLLWEHDGLIYGVHLYDETREETEPFGSGTIRLKADIRLVPFLFGWYHIIPKEHVMYAFGAGLGLYQSKAFSGGVTATSQVKDVGDFRFLQDDTYAGLHLFFGADFFPEARWGLGAESRLHLVENDFDAVEFGVSGIFRF